MEKIVITEKMQMLIAATYVMLTFDMRNYLIHLLNKIIIYPSNYYSTVNKECHKGEFNPKMNAVVFSWEDFLLGHSALNDNVNLGLHEFYDFANQFEFLSVILEHFFETPHVFKATHPELYAHIAAMINFNEDYFK